MRQIQNADLAQKPGSVMFCCLTTERLLPELEP
jgi:hypothetical protein